MLSKKQISWINALKVKKYRKIQQAFLVEGEKNVAELLQSNFHIIAIYALESWIAKNAKTCNLHQQILHSISPKELKRISNLQTPNEVAAIVQLPTNHNNTNLISQALKLPLKNHVLALDNISDPGNLGTIIRIADWFGIDTVICSPTCVDAYSPKVVQATMGSIFHIQLIYNDLQQLFENYPQTPVYAALLQGSDIFATDFSKKGIILMGNESKGIQQKYFKYMSQAITIPRKGKAESLNVAVATSIICAIACK
ncbi:MAG: TrmH family RNA methyltransferase [Chitinophagales bacterium]